MGTWGTGIKENDTFEDVYSTFIESYHSGKKIREITEKLIKEYSDIEKNNDEYADFWIAIAYSQWMCKGLQKKVLNRIIEIYKTNKGLDIWTEESGADKGTFEKHKKAIGKFIEKIKIPRPTAIKRKKIIARPSFFKPGDCLAIKLSNEKYGAGYVLHRDNRDPKNGLTTIAIIRYQSKAIPNIEAIMKGEILHDHYKGFPNNYAIKEFLARSMTKNLKKLEVIGNVPISDYTKNYLKTKYRYVPFMWGHWPYINDFIIMQMEYDKKHKTKFPKISIENLISTKCDQYWELVKLDYYGKVKG